MICPHCSAEAEEVTDAWHTFPVAQGAEYLSTYVTIWHCPACETMVGTRNGSIEWVIEPEPRAARGEG